MGGVTGAASCPARRARRGDRDEESILLTSCGVNTVGRVQLVVLWSAGQHPATPRRSQEGLARLWGRVETLRWGIKKETGAVFRQRLTAAPYCAAPRTTSDLVDTAGVAPSRGCRTKWPIGLRKCILLNPSLGA